jgi:competence protein ComFA
MLAPQYFLYLATGPADRSKVDLTSNPRIDAGFLIAEGFQTIYLIRPPQPLWIVENILEKLSADSRRITPRLFLKRAIQSLKELTSGVRFSHEQLQVNELLANRMDPPDLAPLFRGRCLLLGEIPELLRSNGQDPTWDAEEWMQLLYCAGKVIREAAVAYDRIGLAYCRRCGSTKQIIEDNCIFCGNTRCLTCTNCQSMGLAKSCLPLYSAPNPERLDSKGNIEPILSFQLTPPQCRASDQLKLFWEQAAKEFLVWAVCGAGKTEVSFGIIAKALSQGARVLVAIPRKDVVQELLPRFEKAFPEIGVTGLYGGSGDRFPDVPLTIATTHQCLRFYQNFDLIILDEGDAYPYQGSAMLHFAVRRSLKPEGKMVIMTATPDRNLIRKAISGKIPYVTIPARPHRKPLIVPELIKQDLRIPAIPGSKWEPESVVKQFLIDIKTNNRRGLLFLPTIKLINIVGQLLILWAQRQGIRGSLIHSQVKNRETIKAQLVNGAIDFLVASTVLERGVTIPNLDVLVLLADNETVFDSPTLIQIAGRCGRKGEPGRVVLIGKNITKAMRESRQWIIGMNEEGRKLGYLDS